MSLLMRSASAAGFASSAVTPTVAVIQSFSTSRVLSTWKRARCCGPQRSQSARAMPVEPTVQSASPSASARPHPRVRIANLPRPCPRPLYPRASAALTAGARASERTLAVDAASERSTGTLYALLAYGIWGFAPIYWKGVQHFPAAELLAYRVLASLGVALAMIVVLRAGRELADALRSPR